MLYTIQVERIQRDGRHMTWGLGFNSAIPRPLSDCFVTSLSQISPASVVEGSAGQIKLTGANFRPTHQVLLNGKKIESRFINGRELEVKIPPTNAGTHKITVIDPGIAASESNAAYLVVSFK